MVTLPDELKSLLLEFKSCLLEDILPYHNPRGREYFYFHGRLDQLNEVLDMISERETDEHSARNT